MEGVFFSSIDMRLRSHETQTQEMHPLIIAGSARIGKFPVVSGALIDWIPVDVAAHSTIELAFSEQAPGSTSVHHIVNPSPCRSSDIAFHLVAAGVPICPTSPDEWWAAIRRDEDNPCLLLESYIEEAFVDAQTNLDKTGGAGVTLETRQTLAIGATSLSRCPALDKELWRKYIDYWRRIGFLENNLPLEAV